MADEAGEPEAPAGALVELAEREVEVVVELVELEVELVLLVRVVVDATAVAAELA